MPKTSNNTPLLIAFGFMLGTVFGFLAAPEIVPHLPKISEGWATLYGALLGAMLTGISALLVVYKQHRLTQRAQIEAKFSELLAILNAIDEIIGMYSDIEETEYFKSIKATEGLFSEAKNRELNTAARKCFRQARMLDGDFRRYQADFDDIDFSGAIPFVIRQQYRDILRQIRNIQGEVERYGTEFFANCSYSELGNAAYDTVVLTIPSNLREINHHIRSIRSEIENQIAI
ncbi:hypothetical protein TH9_10695 [Thalassospira xiamenensis]|uniref:hypothetical protein n=1 Tax=Thalassospira xiamenensis TaxID=220697 RepID=UPI000DED8814|nr:hypothetical protein [Thalassospira xiamenensis]RCK33354.1 hypothetical protein TH9_10695 [Thalassospira xiamenensis]